MYFSFIILGIILILSVIVWKKKYSWKTYIGYLEPYGSSLDSYMEGEYTRDPYFYYSEGVINLKEHPELHRFHVIGGKDVLVRTWDRQEELTLTEGVTRIAIFEIVPDTDRIVAIPCLRTVDRVLIDDVDDPLSGYKETTLGVSWGGNNFNVLPSENLIGVVEYESI